MQPHEHSTDYAIGVDVGGTRLRVVLADRSGQLLADIDEASRAAQGPAAVCQRIVGHIAALRARLPAGGRLLGVGVGAPGPLDSEQGIIFMAPNMPGWHNVPLRAMLAEQTGLPVVLNNDANAAVLGEWLFGGAAGYRHAAYVTVSTGIGTGIISDGRLVQGHQGAGTELGQVIIDYTTLTTWENLASGTALAAAAADAMQAQPATDLHQLATPQQVTGQHVARAAAAGDTVAQALMEREARLLGIGFLNLLYAYSPQIVLVGGSVVTANPALLDGARQVVQQHALVDIYRAVPIEVAHLGDRVGRLGAVALIFSQHEA
jgi:glucokinase